ncbi:MAG: DUF1446 domain-containing protein [Bacteroidia bacterium]|nr:DUF1446 domain-containing protein [Bacteroidia bacterium]
MEGKAKNKVIIANISGFYGDRFSAAREMIDGGPVDFLTGDYLAELTMAILFKAKSKKADLGYARTFLKQMEGIMGDCLDKNIRVVVNAGGLNPLGLAEGLKSVAKHLGLHPKIAYIDGDDLMPSLLELRSKGARLQHLEKNITLSESGMMPVSANAYLGCWGIVKALDLGADIIVTGRVADTSVVMGPAAHHFGWKQNDWDQLASAATAGHIIECSGQASGGNYSFFEEVPSFTKVGFPIAEISRTGDFSITKHPNTGGLVSIGTVTAQLLYEINAPEYITPDVVAHFDTINIVQESPDRVSVSDVKGSPPTRTSKVTVNCLGGFQNMMQLYILGLDVDKKVDILKTEFLNNIGGPASFDKIDFHFIKNINEDPSTHEEAFSTFRVTVIDKDPQKAGKFFTSKMIELALCAPPGWCMSAPPGPAKPRIIHFPALIEKKYLKQQLHYQNEDIYLAEVTSSEDIQVIKSYDSLDFSFHHEETEILPLGTIYAARSGDKGGNANLGIWGKTNASYAFLEQLLSVEKLKELLPETASFKIARFEFPNLLGLNFYIKGFLQEGVAATTKMDGQAKTLGEYLRMKKVQIPKELLDGNK